jgi:hypothetical protein
MKTVDGKIVYDGCRCLSEGSNKEIYFNPQLNTDIIQFAGMPQSVTQGFCKNESCDTMLYIFVAIFALTVFIHSTSEVGGMLIIMRCTHPKDKAMAMGVVQFSIGLMSNIPCPHIFGRIIDATCILFAKICGNDGHCLFYNVDTFRRLFFGEFLFIGL